MSGFCFFIFLIWVTSCRSKPYTLWSKDGNYRASRYQRSRGDKNKQKHWSSQLITGPKQTRFSFAIAHIDRKAKDGAWSGAPLFPRVIDAAIFVDAFEAPSVSIYTPYSSATNHVLSKNTNSSTCSRLSELRVFTTFRGVWRLNVCTSCTIVYRVEFNCRVNCIWWCKYLHCTIAY